MEDNKNILEEAEIKGTISNKTKNRKFVLVRNGIALALAVSTGFAIKGLYDDVVKFIENDNNDIITVSLKAHESNNTINELPIIDKNGKVHVIDIENDYVVTTDNLSKDSEDGFVNVKTIDEFGNKTEGMIPEINIDSQTKVSNDEFETLYIVNSVEGLNVRSEPKYLEDNSNVVTRLNDNEYILGGEMISGDFKWTKITYKTSEGLQEGYVSGDFLTKVTSLEELSSYEASIQTEVVVDTVEQQQVLDNYTTNDGKILGLDAAFIEPKVLDQYLKGEISFGDSIDTTNLGTLDVSFLDDKKINYVYLRGGYSGWGNQHKSFIADNVFELAKVCEENQIPYGFYWYSTAVNEEEANLESSLILEQLNDERLADSKYNMMPYAIDVEKKNDGRQQNYAKEQVTDAKIHLANTLSKAGVQTILYTENRANATFFDAARYVEEVNSDVWTVWPVGFTEKSAHGSFGVSMGESLTMKQIVLDGNGIDLNLLDEQSFISYVNGAYAVEQQKSNSITYTYE